MKLYAISDLHIACDVNRRAVENFPHLPDDWLILAGDVCERESDLRWALGTLRSRFARILWTPGNHELVNHFPLRCDLASTPMIPRFSLWCGTHRTEQWHILPAPHTFDRAPARIP